MARYQIVEDGSVVGFVDSDGGSFTWFYSGEMAEVQSLLIQINSFETHTSGPDADLHNDPDVIGGTVLSDANPKVKMGRFRMELFQISGVTVE